MNLFPPALRAFAWLIKETHGDSAIPALLEVRQGKFTPCLFRQSPSVNGCEAKQAAFEVIWK